MLRKFTKAIFVSLLLPLCNYAQSGNVVPPAYTDTAGGGGFSMFSSAARSYQWLIDSTLLTTLMNDTLSDISFRGQSGFSSTWPTAATTFNNFDIYIGKAVPLPSMDTVFASNQSGAQTQVRSGSLVIPANTYPAGGITSWGPPIGFSTPYIYTGGNLSILLRHNGYNSGTQKSLDAISTNNPNYNVHFKAKYAASYTAVNCPTAGNFIVLRFGHSSSPLPVELTSFNCAVAGYDARIYWVSASEKNVKDYIVQKSLDGIQFRDIQAIPATGWSDQEQKYEYTDINAFQAEQTVFYRLKMIDYDGSFKYSGINKLSNGKVRPTNLIVYPNPVKSICNISYTLSADTKVTCRVYDIAGRVVYADIAQNTKGGNDIIADFSQLPKGQYNLVLTGKGVDDSFKFIKD